MKRVRTAFRTVRDLDVLRLSLNELPGLRTLDANALAEVEAILADRRERAAAAAKRIGQRPRLAKDLTSLETLIAAFATFAEREPLLVQEQLTDRLRRRAAALLNGDPRDETTHLHQTRIRVKQMRYCTQQLEECRCTDVGDLLEELTQVQILLGHWSDQIVAARTLSRIAGRWRILTANTSFSQKLLDYAALQAGAALENRQKVLDRWPTLVAAIKRSLPDLADAGIPGDLAEPSDSSVQDVERVG